jgi:hypothetical protein
MGPRDVIKMARCPALWLDPSKRLILGKVADSYLKVTAIVESLSIQTKIRT